MIAAELPSGYPMDGRYVAVVAAVVLVLLVVEWTYSRKERRR